jgi:hypothetical protein
MPNKLQQMNLSPEEERFLRSWMYDEVHYQEGVGTAKQLQLQHRVAPADLAVLIAAAMPDPADQEAAGFTPPSEAPAWPWSEMTWRHRLEEARAVLSERKSVLH